MPVPNWPELHNGLCADLPSEREGDDGGFPLKVQPAVSPRFFSTGRRVRIDRLPRGDEARFAA